MVFRNLGGLKRSLREWVKSHSSELLVGALLLLLGFISPYIFKNPFEPTAKEDSAASQLVDSTFEKAPRESLDHLNYIIDNKKRVKKTVNLVHRIADKIIIQQSYSGQKYVFNKHEESCFTLVDALDKLYREDPKAATGAFNNLILRGPDRYEKYSRPEELYKLLSWVADRDKDLTTKLPKKSRELLNVPRYTNTTTHFDRLKAIFY